MFSTLEQPRIELLGAWISASVLGRGAFIAPATPTLGEHTDEVLSEILHLSDGQIGKLRDKHVIAGPIRLSAGGSR